MAFHSNLQKRETGYYFRQSVPLPLVLIVGKKEVVKSLGTKDPLEAKNRCRVFSVKISLWFDSLLTGKEISESELPALSFKNAPLMPVQNNPSPVADDSMLLSALLEAWANNRRLLTDEARDKNSTYVEGARAVRYYVEQFGDDAITAITKEKIALLKQHYQEAKGLNPLTTNKYLGFIRTLLNFAHTQGFIPANNIPSGVFTVAVLHEDESNRRPFTREELQRLFSSPYFTGYKSSARKHVAGELITKNAFYWCPLVSLFTGMRLEEIAQLSVDNVKQEGEIWFIEVSAAKPYQHLKNAGSRRRIPVHHELQNLGFLKYHQQMKETQQEQLFPELKASKEGRLGKGLSQSFRRYNDRIGLTDKNLVFHSFRHTFKDACREARIERDVHDKLTGHTDSSVSGSYGSGFSLSRLSEAIKKIRYGVDLSHLYDTDAVIRPDDAPAALVPVAPASHYIPLSEAFEQIGKAKYGDAFDYATIRRFAQDVKYTRSIRGKSMLLDTQRLDLLEGHPLFSNAESYQGLEIAPEALCVMAEWVRGAIIKGLAHDSIKSCSASPDGALSYDKKQPWLCNSPDFKVYFTSSVVDVKPKDGAYTEYKITVEEGSLKEWIRKCYAGR